MEFVVDWKQHSFHVENEIDGNASTRTNTGTQDLKEGMCLLSTSTLEYLESLDKDTENEDLSRKEKFIIADDANRPDVLVNHSENVENTAVHTASDSSLRPGQYVLATYSTKTGHKLYLGLVLQVDMGEAQVKFCRQHGDYFVWPSEEDISWID